jgi:hypothetical protein
MRKNPTLNIARAALALSFARLFAMSPLEASTPFGVYEGPGAGGATQISVFSHWFGRQPDRALDFFANDTWASLESDAAWGCASWSPNAVAVVPAMTFSVPLTVNGTSLADVAAGLHDSSFIAVANSLVSNNWGGSVVRLGWEFNGSWMPWAAVNDPVSYVAAYRHVVALMRSVPGAHFKFDWCTSWGQNATAPDSVYPGDDVVDIVGMDVYNRYYAAADADPAHRWNTFLTASYGLDWLASFSLAHGKPLSVPEWGTGEWLVGDGGTGGGDDGLFVTNMINFMKSNGAAYSDYWDISASGYDASVSNGEHPTAGADLKAAYASAPAAPLVNNPAISPPGPILWVGAGGSPTTSSVSINFSPPYGGGAADHFEILYRPSGTSSWATYGTAEVVGTQSLTGLSPGTSYDVSVMGVNAGGSGPQSSPIALSTLSAAALPPAAPVVPVGRVVPVALVAPVTPMTPMTPVVPGVIPWIGQGDVSTTNSISINFSPTYGGGTPNSYTILYRITGSSSWITYGSVASVGWQTLGGLLSGTSYDVSVEAVNAGGSGPQSAVISLATLPGASPGVALPGEIPWIGQGEASTSTTISINFCPPNGGGTPTGYVILIRVSGQTTWQNYSVVTWTGWQTISGLAPGISYDTEVYATNAAGSGQPSAIYTASTL